MDLGLILMIVLPTLFLIYGGYLGIVKKYREGIFFLLLSLIFYLLIGGRIIIEVISPF